MWRYPSGNLRYSRRTTVRLPAPPHPPSSPSCACMVLSVIACPGRPAAAFGYVDGILDPSTATSSSEELPRRITLQGRKPRRGRILKVTKSDKKWSISTEVLRDTRRFFWRFGRKKLKKVVKDRSGRILAVLGLFQSRNWKKPIYRPFLRTRVGPRVTFLTDSDGSARSP